MRGITRITLALSILLASFGVGVATITAAAPAAGADQVGSCIVGTTVTTGLTLSVDGVAATSSMAGVYAANGTEWALTVCRDTGNRVYIVMINRVNRMMSGPPTYWGLTADDLNRSFTVTFTPQSGDIPLIAEGHGNINNFSIGSTVSLTAKPVAYSDIWGSDCNNQMPSQCVLTAPRASVDYPAQFSVGVRYQDAQGNGGADFGSLPGMYWSSSAFYFYQRVNCPAMTNQDPNFMGLQVEMGGPHLKHDGTQNFGYVEVYIPAPALLTCFGGTPDMVKAALSITRTEGSTTTAVTENGDASKGLDYDITTDANGMLIVFRQVAFSKPTYKITTRNAAGTVRNVNLSRGSKTYAQMNDLFGPAKLTLPAGGRFVVTTSTPSICRPGTGTGQGAKVFFLAKGQCTFTVTAYSALGVKVGSSKLGGYAVP